MLALDAAALLNAAAVSATSSDGVVRDRAIAAVLQGALATAGGDAAAYVAASGLDVIGMQIAALGGSWRRS